MVRLGFVTGRAVNALGAGPSNGRRNPAIPWTGALVPWHDILAKWANYLN